MTMTTPRATACKSFYCQPATFKSTIFLNSLCAVFATRGGVPTSRRHPWTNYILIKPDDQQKQFAQQITNHFQVVLLPDSKVLQFFPHTP